jgi:hypothetical protein
MHILSEDVIQHSQLLYDSFVAVRGKALLEPQPSREYLAEALYHAPFVLLSHGIQPDPVFNYANLSAQQLWEMDWQKFTQLPSRLSAEPVAVSERQAMLEEARKKDFIENYQGVRIASSGKRFTIKNAVLWNVYDLNRTYRGQAAMFKEWVFL